MRWSAVKLQLWYSPWAAELLCWCRKSWTWQWPTSTGRPRFRRPSWPSPGWNLPWWGTAATVRPSPRWSCPWGTAAGCWGTCCCPSTVAQCEHICFICRSIVHRCSQEYVWLCNALALFYSWTLNSHCKPPDQGSGQKKKLAKFFC